MSQAPQRRILPVALFCGRETGVHVHPTNGCVRGPCHMHRKCPRTPCTPERRTMAALNLATSDRSTDIHRHDGFCPSCTTTTTRMCKKPGHIDKPSPRERPFSPSRGFMLPLGGNLTNVRFPKDTIPCQRDGYSMTGFPLRDKFERMDVASNVAQAAMVVEIHATSTSAACHTDVTLPVY